MTPTPDWNRLGLHNKRMVTKIKIDKIIVDKKQRDKREVIMLSIASIVMIILGCILYTCNV